MGEAVTNTRAVPIPGAFEPFISKCREEFDTSLSAHGFSAPEILIHPPDCAVRYSKPDLRLTFHYEVGSRPWATVEALLARGWKQQALDRLIHAAAPDLAARLRTADEASVMPLYAEFITGHFQGILSGNFSLLGRG